jgi:hypothetical protein
MYFLIECIDSNSVNTNIRAWGVDKNDHIEVNKPYMVKVNYDDTWGFSTRGRINKYWKQVG